jgi:hypothetical protein
MNRGDFLRWVFEYCERGQVETRALPKKKQEYHDLTNLQAIDVFCKKHTGQNLYFAPTDKNSLSIREV